MPVAIKYLDDGRGALYTASDPLTADDFSAAMKLINLRDLIANPILYAFVDLDDITRIERTQTRIPDLVAIFSKRREEAAGHAGLGGVREARHAIRVRQDVHGAR